MDSAKTFVLTLLMLGGIFLVTSRISYPHSDFSAEPPTDEQAASLLNSGKEIALFICRDANACEYMKHPLEELSYELGGGLVLYKVNSDKYCAQYPQRCPKQLPAVILYNSEGARVFYGDIPKEWLKEYLLGYRSAK